MSGVVAWIVVGLVAGGLASALPSGRPSIGLLQVVGIGVIGALCGGSIGEALLGAEPWGFLGSVIAGVVSAVGAVGAVSVPGHTGGTRSYRSFK